MAATTTIQNGTAMKLWVAISGVQTLVANGKTVSEESSRTVIDTTSQTSGMYSESIMGRFDPIKFSGTFLLKESTTGVGVSYQQLYTLYSAATPTAFNVQLHSGNPGDQHLNTTCYITSLKKTSGDNQSVTFDATFQSTGSFSSATS